MLQTSNTGSLDSDDEWRGRSVGIGAEETIVIRRHNDANNERAESIEDGQAVNESSCSLWDVAAGRNGLSGSQRNEFW